MDLSVYEAKRIEVQSELQRERRLVPVDRSIFLKTDKEKAELKNIILNHKKRLRLAGVDPRKRMNL